MKDGFTRTCRQKLLGQLRKLFRPEFLNRVDAVVVFRSLNHDDIREIVGIEIAKLRTRLLESGHDIRLTDRGPGLVCPAGSTARNMGRAHSGA